MTLAMQGITELEGMEHVMFPGTGVHQVHQRLIIYIFAHLTHCSADETRLSLYKTTLDQWQEWDSVAMIQHEQEIRNVLLKFRRGLPCFKMESPSLRGILNLDTIGLCAHLSIIAADRDKSKALVSRSGSNAQSVINLLQARLDLPLSSAYKRYHVRTLIKLSKIYGLYPKCLLLTGLGNIGEPVAAGGFADLYKGRLRGQTIAVKVLRFYQQSDVDQLAKEFSSEAVTWRQLTHPNVLPFYGTYHLNENLSRVCFVSPWIENGDLVHYLDRVPHSHCVILSLDIAHGLEYLHSEHIIHGDLKGLNVLVTTSGRACLADFGLATASEASRTIRTHRSTTMKGTVRFQAPEFFPDMNRLDSGSPEYRTTFASDVYAFALVCYQMFSDNLPFHDIPNDMQVIFAVKAGKRPSRPTHYLSRIRGLNNEIWALVEACWAQAPSERPTSGGIVERLRALPSMPIDDRPPDNFNPLFAYHVSRDQTDNPFSNLTTYADEMTAQN